MHSSSIAVSFVRCFAAAVPVILIASASLADTTYFAEDLNYGTDTVRVDTSNVTAKRDEFLAALTGAVTETFESQTPDSAQPWTLVMGTLTGTGPSTTMVSFPSPTGTFGGRFAFSGSNFFQQSDEYEPIRYSATLLLNAPQRAFGFFASDWGDAGPLDGTRPTVTVTYTDNTTATFTAPASILGTDISGSASFFGLTTDKAFNKVEIVNGTGSRTTGYDDFIVASQLTPSAALEPGSAALLLTAGLGIPMMGFLLSEKAPFTRLIPLVFTPPPTSQVRLPPSEREGG